MNSAVYPIFNLTIAGGPVHTKSCLQRSLRLSVASQYHPEPWALTPFPPHVTMNNPLAQFQLCQSKCDQNLLCQTMTTLFALLNAGSIRMSLFIQKRLINSPWLPTNYRTLYASSVPILIHRDSTIQSFQPSCLPYLLLQPSPDEPLIRMSTFTRTKENI